MILMTNDDYVKKMQAQDEMTEEEQKIAGAPIQGNISNEHKSFAETLLSLIKSGEIDPEDNKSFLNIETYESLDEDWKDKTDLSLVNISQQIKLIANLCSLPNFSIDSPQLQTMVEQLWQMKQKIEEKHDVFKF
ncbi:MAG: hypothetical protein KAS32_18990 [Candidatus Peribacteraceae bacterium]|nr:hypothetical protein [Candidatus Peribacteraceae bacterium]